MRRIKTLIFILCLTGIILLGACSQQTPNTTKPPTNEPSKPGTPSQPDPAQPNPDPPEPTTPPQPPTTPPQTENYWKQLGGALDIDSGHNAVRPKLLLDRNGNLVVTWAEDDGVWNLQAKRWTGTAWERLASKALPFTEVGVNDFDVVIDSSNALVVSERASSGQVAIYRNTGSSWSELGQKDISNIQLETDAGGNVHGFYKDESTSTYTIKQWNGTTWVTIADFSKNLCESTPCFAEILSFQLKSDGKPIVFATDIRGNDARTFYGWNGSGWDELDAFASTTAAVVTWMPYTINANNEVIFSYRYTRGGQIEIDYTKITSKTKTYDNPGGMIVEDLAVRNNEPVALYRSDVDAKSLNVSFYNTSANTWKKVDRRLERDGNKVGNEGSALVDENGNTFVVWQEAACTNSASCGGGNIYVT
jgi:hypothetical protein